MDRNENVIEVHHVSKLYGLNKTEAVRLMEAGSQKKEVQKKTGVSVALWDINLEIPRGQIFVIIGLSGSGKSTLVRCFNRLNKPTSGSVCFNGRDLSKLSKKELLTFRRNNISMVFQSFGLMSHRDVLGNVAYGLEVKGVSKAEREKKAMEVISMVGLSGWEHQSCKNLSGGMRQRVGIAMAMTFNPELLLADEPTSALDVTTQAQIVRQMMELRDDFHTSIIIVTHNIGVAAYMADQLIVMQHGKVVDQGTRDEVMNHPTSDYTKKLLAAVPEMEGRRFV